MLILGIVLVGSLVPIAQAVTLITPSCGETINPGDNVVLGGDVGPCGAPGPALTVDSAKLDLGGFTVSCDGTIDGIQVVGAKSELVNGTVKGCNVGVFVGYNIDVGKHTVKNVTSRDNSSDGFYIESVGNQLSNNNANLNNGAGFFMVGPGNNKLSDNQAHKNNGSGFYINASDNKLQGNMAIGNHGPAGFHIDDGATENKLMRNYALNNDLDGIRITSGGLNNDVLKNTATGNNAANVGAFDLKDENANCDGNTWKKNLFGTKSQDCIQ